MTKIGLGLAALGRPEYINIREDKNVDRSEQAFFKNTMDMLDTAYEVGIRYFDTAPSYGKGELFLKKWQESRNHKDTDLATKWGYTYVADWQLGYKGAHEIKEHSLEKLVEQWSVSNTMLPALKVYQIHSATLESGVLDHQEVLQKLMSIKRETGLTIGLTSSGVAQDDILRKAKSIQVEGVDLFDLFQVTYNVFEQSTYKVLQDLISEGKKVVIKEGVANGRIFQNSPNLLKDLAKKYQVGVDAIALRFICDSINPYMILSGAFSKKQLLENLKTFTFALTQHEIQSLQSMKIHKEQYWSERQKLNWE